MTPFAAETAWTRDERGAEFWLVAIRACLEIDPDGRQSPAAEQTEVQRTPVFEGDPLTSGLLHDSDFALHKEGTDVLVEGRVYAPESRPETHCSARLKVSSVDKTLNVVGERRLSKGLVGLSIAKPMPFLEMPLTWSRAYGGWDRKGRKEQWEPSNPAGKGFASDPHHLDGTMAPNFEYPGEPYRGPGKCRAAAFGPVAAHWQPRLRYAGTYDKLWQETRAPLPPADFDRRHFRCAPDDQQTQKSLVGYEEVILQGFTPQGFLGFVLPRISFDIVTTFTRYGDIRQRPSIQTLWLMPDLRRFEVVYASALEVPPGREEKLIGTTVFMRKQINTLTSILRTGVWSPR
ncbi:DUF2169 domain-containing protein [Pseudomonas chlororaphis subsp. aurantiaca]|uniref:DUF2169 family type VI secretion system accessory protein n=1 Tax=Pseudomonas chlororaphis TaxID=587753 RepID=UPI0027DBD839|nr:DUF2169 domain-containing protein [Pseudomonas chlororaphis]WMJ02456.1 DUF2169 domain-containing protein [Pseudomonas chlororaphis subsp. aurantiaca]